MKTQLIRCIGAVSPLALFLVAICYSGLAHGQQRQSLNSDDATLVVEGQVVDVYRSVSSETQSLVKILVQKSEARIEDLSGSTRFPAPGEMVFVQVNEKVISRRALDSPQLPRPNMVIRASLSPGKNQQWQGRSSGWFRELAERSSVASNPLTNRVLGIQAELMGDTAAKRGVKVSRVTPDTAAAKAGIEVGDVLVKANGVELDSLARLEQQVARSTRSMQLTVRDVRTGRDFPVDVDLNSKTASRGPRRSLGVTTELAFYGGNPALKIVKVAAGEAADRAGLKTGWLIVSADGRALGKPEMLSEAEQNADDVMRLKVVDPKTREQRDVRVNLR